MTPTETNIKSDSVIVRNIVFSLSLGHRLADYFLEGGYSRANFL